MNALTCYLYPIFWPSIHFAILWFFDIMDVSFHFDLFLLDKWHFTSISYLLMFIQHDMNIRRYDTFYFHNQMIYIAIRHMSFSLCHTGTEVHFIWRYPIYIIRFKRSLIVYNVILEVPLLPPFIIIFKYLAL